MEDLFDTINLSSHFYVIYDTIISYTGRVKQKGAFEHAQNAPIQIHVTHVQSLIRAFSHHSYILLFAIILVADGKGFDCTKRMRRPSLSVSAGKHVFALRRPYSPRKMSGDVKNVTHLSNTRAAGMGIGITGTFLRKRVTIHCQKIRDARTRMLPRSER